MDWHAIADKMHDYGFRQAVITLGGDGSVVIDGDGIHRISPVRVQARDTTGCGDSFMGTILAGLSSGMTLMDSAQLASYVLRLRRHQLRRAGPPTAPRRRSRAAFA